MGFIESVRKRGLIETIKRLEENVVWDVMDAMPTDNAPMAVQQNLPGGGEFPLMDRLFNRGRERNGQAELWRSVTTLAPGTYGMRMNVGKSAEGTAHPHFFIIDRDTDGAMLLFVDPEHYLNKNKRSSGHPIREGDIRPKVCNLLAIRVRGENIQPDFAATRFRTSEIENPQDVSFETQLRVARNLFKNQGMPPMLEQKEHELIFRLVIEASADGPMLIQSRYAKEEELRAFLLTGKTTPFLEGKRRAFTGIMEEFSARIKRGEFTAKPNLMPKPVGSE